MSNVTTSRAWPLNPGDLIVAELTDGFLRILHRTPSDLEAERLVKESSGPDREIVVVRYMGRT